MENEKIPVEVLKALFVAKKLHVLNTYMHITRNPKFSGHVSKKKLQLLASEINKSTMTVRRHLSALCNEGLMIDCGSVFMSTGADNFAGTTGFRRCKFVKYNKDLRSLAFAIVISEQFYWQLAKERRNRERKTQDWNEGLKASISCAYTVNYLDRLGLTYSPQEVSKMRVRAAKLGFISYNRVYQPEEMNAFDFLQQQEFGNSPSGTYIDCSGRVIKELPALFSHVLHFPSRGVSNSLKKQASIIWDSKKGNR